MRVLLVTPPMTDLNTPYPATAYLTAFLRQRGVATEQRDLSLETASRLFSQEGLDRLAAAAPKRPKAALAGLLAHRARYAETIDTVLSFLRAGTPGIAEAIRTRGFLPEGSHLTRYYEGVGRVYPQPTEAESPVDFARFLATRYVQDIVDAFAETEPGFGVSAYAPAVAGGPAFDQVLRFLRQTDGGLVPGIIDEVAESALVEVQPDVLGITVPFPGNVVGALRVARVARRVLPDVKIVLGGGFANCYLRRLDDPRFFDFVDFVTLDDGERPLWCVLEHVRGSQPAQGLHRTFVRVGRKVVYREAAGAADIAFRDTATPTYDGLPLDRYLALQFDLTPAARIWSRHWNKLTLAHGCYWRKCTFCDTSVDYVARYEPQRVDRLVRQIEELVEETGHPGFHWVDEAAPPALLAALSKELVARSMGIRWWSNIRFEKAFTPEVARGMAQAGCVMVTGGLEVASNRLLERMRKGVTVEQVARVAKGFADAGVTVHAYLMYGFPTQTVQETVDSLEIVRQLFRAGCLHSARWHRFFVTQYSPIGIDAHEHGVRLKRRRVKEGRSYALYWVPFKDGTWVNHDLLAPGLTEAVIRFRRGLDLERPVHEWFPIPVPGTTVDPERIAEALAAAPTAPESP